MILTRLLHASVAGHRGFALRRILGAGFAALLGCFGPASADSGAERGAALYAAECAACHGTRLQGQPRWWQANPEGRLPAPPLDASGHAWQHSDADLADLIANGMANVAGPDYRSDMPAFAGRLGEAEIGALLAYIKAQWPEGIRASQSMLNPGGEAVLADLLGQDGDWSFPPDCLTPMQRAAVAASAGRTLSPTGR